MPRGGGARPQSNAQSARIKTCGGAAASATVLYPPLMKKRTCKTSAENTWCHITVPLVRARPLVSGMARVGGGTGRSQRGLLRGSVRRGGPSGRVQAGRGAVAVHQRGHHQHQPRLGGGRGARLRKRVVLDERLARTGHAHTGVAVAAPVTCRQEGSGVSGRWASAVTGAAVSSVSCQGRFTVSDEGNPLVLHAGTHRSLCR